MEIDWLKDFLALEEHGTFSRAADARNVSQPAFRRRIRALEDWIGAPLFRRGAQGAGLTLAGAHFKPLAGDLLRAIEQARRGTRAVGERDTASLSIAATHALSFTFFPGWIRAHADFQGLGAVNLLSDSMDACERIMLAGEVHFLLCHCHGGMPNRLTPDRFDSMVVGGDTLVPLRAPEGADGRFLGYGPASALGRILAAVAPVKAATAALETAFTSHLAATLLTMAREGHGIAWLPHTLAADDLRDGRLVRAGGEEMDVAMEIRLFRAPDCRNKTADDLWARLQKRETEAED